MRSFVIFLFAFVCMLTHTSTHASDWHVLSPAVESLNLHYRVEARKGAVFGIDIAEGDTLRYRRFEARVPSTWPDDFNNSMGVKIVFISDGQDSTRTATVFADKPRSVDISMKISGAPTLALLEVGDRAVTFSAPVDLCDTVPLYVRFFSDKNAKSLRETYGFEPKAPLERCRFASTDALYDYLAESADPCEGLWTFYDRTTSPLRTAPNGQYTLATVKASHGYDIVFIRDNEGIPSQWKPLTVKGKLHKCDIPGVFDVTWYDRHRGVVGSRISGVIEGNILTVSFPYYKTALRFNRINLRNQ